MEKFGKKIEHVVHNHFAGLGDHLAAQSRTTANGSCRVMAPSVRGRSYCRHGNKKSAGSELSLEISAKGATTFGAKQS